MKSRIFLYPLAAALVAGSLFSCGKNEGRPDQTLASPDLVAKRTEKLGLAALFPEEMSVVTGVYNIPEIAQGLKNLQLVRLIASQEDASLEEFGIDEVSDVMLGLGAGTAEWLMKAIPVVQAYGRSQVNDLAGFINGRSNEQGKSQIEMNRDMLLNLLDIIDLQPSDRSCAPLMLAATLSPEVAKQLKSSLNEIGLPQGQKLYGVISLSDQVYNGIPCKVAEVDCKALKSLLAAQWEEFSQNDFAVAVSPSDQARVETILNRLDTARLFLAVGFKDEQTLVAFVTSNPEKQVKLAQSPEKSILKWKNFSMADSHLAYKPYGLTYVDREVVKAFFELSKAYRFANLDGWDQLIREKGAAWKVKDMESVQKSMEIIREEYRKGFARIESGLTTASSAYAWQDKGVQLDVTTYPTYLWNLTSTTPLSGVRPSEDSVFYYCGESDEKSVQSGVVMTEQVANIAWNLSEAYLNDPQNPLVATKPEARMYIPVLKMALPQLKQLWNGLKSVNRALGDAEVIKIDWNQNDKASFLLGGLPAPRLCVVNELKNGSQLSEGWKDIQDSVNAFIPLATNGAMAQMPEAREIKNGEVTTYAYALPFGEELNPVVSLTNSRWCLSMPQSFGVDQLRNSMKPDPQAKPLEMVLNLLPVYKVLKSAHNAHYADIVDTLKCVISDVQEIRMTGELTQDKQELYHIHIVPGTQEAQQN